MRLQTMTSADRDPGTVLETEVAGFVKGSGRTGVRGPVVSRKGRSIASPAGLPTRSPCAIAHRIMVRMRCRTLRVASGRTPRIGGRTGSTSTRSMWSGGTSPSRGKEWRSNVCHRLFRCLPFQHRAMFRSKKRFAATRRVGARSRRFSWIGSTPASMRVPLASIFARACFRESRTAAQADRVAPAVDRRPENPALAAATCDVQRQATAIPMHSSHRHRANLRGMSACHHFPHHLLQGRTRPHGVSQELVRGNIHVW